ncbi:MAG: ABC transporter substrate-binding protein [Planctomycetota bacterium]
MIRICFKPLFAIRSRAFVIVLSLLCAALTTGSLWAQTDLDKVLEEIEVLGSLMDEEPFDVVTLKPEATGRSVKIAPLEFENRRIPTNVKETDKFQVTILLFPTRRYEVQWKDIGKIWLYEQMILARAKKLVDDKNFGEAFEHLNFLFVNYPQTPGLQVLRQEFLYKSAEEMSRQNRLAHTMAVLEELQKSFPNCQKERVRGLITDVSGQLIESYFQKKDLSSARTMINRLAKQYQDDPLPVVEQWKGKFLDLANEYKAKALEYREKKDYLAARREATKMLDIEPQIEGGKELLRELLKEYPIVRVGVFQTADKPDTAAIANWPAFRSGQLISRPLFEFRSTGPEGGQYRFSLGSFLQSDDRLELEMTIQNPGQAGIPTSLDLSQSFLRRATIGKDEYVPGWAAIFDSVSVAGPEKLKMRFRRPHVLPQAFLQWPIEAIGDGNLPVGVLYKPKSKDGNTQRFEWAPSNKGADFQPMEIHEILYEDPSKAINDLLRGEIEAIDRLFPADARKLQASIVSKTINVESYALPTVHMLVPRTSNPYLDDREFRRALLYAINREGILKGEILGGADAEQSRVISGPFPRGVTENDPIAYAYNTSVDNLAYDPRLAKVLMLITNSKLKMQYEKRKEPLPPIPKMTLGVPNYEAARVAGQAIVEQWKLIGVQADLAVLDKVPEPGEMPNIDILYLTASIWEPATDAERLFGIGGPAQSNNQFIVQVLSGLSASRNWREVRQSCQDLHALVAAHLPVLPLWQVGESFAYRGEISGVTKKPLGLYQDLQKWRVRAP